MKLKSTFLNLLGKMKSAVLLLLISTLFTSVAAAQTVSTASGTNYLGNYSINNPGSLFISFVVENTSGSAISITNISTQLAPYFGVAGGTASAIKIYASSTSLSGVFDITAPGWSVVATGSATVPAALAVTQVISGSNIVIPAGTQYRLVLEATKGLAFSFTPTPTPNIFSNGGINLKVGDNMIAGSAVGYAGVSPTAPAGNAGAFFGGSITAVVTGPCAGMPTPGNALTSLSAVCSGTPFNLSLQNTTPGTGVTYQWQSSPDSTNWTNITGATSSTYSLASLAATTFYRAQVTCAGQTGNSAGVKVSLNPQSACYCLAGATSTSFEKIGRVQFGTINRTSTSTAGYENFITDTASVQKQNPTPITVTIAGGFAADQVLVWIDLNQNGNFDDPGELVYSSSNGVGPHSGTITVPASATLGYTRMRVRMHDTSLGANATPCGNSTYGQVEDYTVNIQPCVPVAVSAQPVNASIQCGAVTTFKLTATGTGLTYLWQQRNNATSPWTNLTNGGVYSGVTTSTLTITEAPVTLNGYQYRVVYTGGCSGTDFSSIATLTVNPLVATVSPVSANLCNGTGQMFTITNIAGVPPTFTSAGPVAVPDASAAGVLIPVTVSGLPAGTPTAIRVTLNMTHTYVGDLDINLIAPNNANLNLIGGLDGGTGSNSSDNFTGTVISSVGTAPISGAAAPRTGVYAAEARPGYGPAGNEQTVATWAGLTAGALNGTWRLAIADFFTGDVGTVSSWSISFVYGTPTGVFSPAAGLFTDAGYTVPYVAGTPVSTIYAKPTVTTNYSVVVTTATCVSAPTVIPITVNNPITGTSSTTNTATCVGGNASFTASAPTSGNLITHQWKVSTDAGATFTNVANGGVYSGATTSTLNITGATAAMNGYRFKDSLYVTACASFVNTNAATLTINPNPVVVLSANPFTALYPGQTTTLTAAVSPNPGATYTWLRNGVVVPGATANTLVVNVDGLGVYTVNVTDVNGCGGSSTASIEIKSAANDILFIYPSPNSGQFQVRYYSQPGNSPLPRVLNIYDSKGSRVYSKKYTINAPYTRLDVNLTNQQRGLYSVELTNGNGVRLKTGRVLIQ